MQRATPGKTGRRLSPHLTDTLEMVRALNIPLARLETDAGEELPDSDKGHPTIGQPPPVAGGAKSAEPFDRTLARWLVLSEASNSINRCRGLPDLYPFVISQVAAQKLGFVHDLIAGHKRADETIPNRSAASGRPSGRK